MLAVAVTNETENQTGRVLFFVPYLALCSISGNLCFCSNTKASPRQQKQCIRPSVPQLSACQEFTLFGRGFSWSDLFCWNVKGLVLEFFLLVHSLLCFVSGYFHLGHSFTSDPAYHWTPFSEMCQLVSGCVAMSVSVSTVSKSPEDDCWAIWSSSPGSQWMPDSQNW